MLFWNSSKHLLNTVEKITLTGKKKLRNSKSATNICDLYVKEDTIFVNRKSALVTYLEKLQHSGQHVLLAVLP